MGKPPVLASVCVICDSRPTYTYDGAAYCWMHFNARKLVDVENPPPFGIRP